MDEQEFWAQQFETNRTRLTRAAYRMLGSAADADDAVQQAWLKLSRSDPGEIHNLAGWLTTVVGRVCLDTLRSRARRAEEPLDLRPVGPVTNRSDAGPEHEALIADSVGAALQIVLDSLSPDERLAFVLHDVFDLPFGEIAGILDRTPVAARKLASRARRRVRGDQPASAVVSSDANAGRPIVEAFLAAARGDDLQALITLLHPDVVLRADAGTGHGGVRTLRGRDAVAGQLVTFHRMATVATSRHLQLEGGPGLVNTVDGSVISVMAFAVLGGRIARIDVLSDLERLDAWTNAHDGNTGLGTEASS